MGLIFCSVERGRPTIDGGERTLTHDGASAEDHGHAAGEIGVEGNLDSRRPSTARQQQMAFRSDLVPTPFARLLAFSL